MNYYKKTVNNTANDVKLKMQIGALTVKITENNDNISSNLTKIGDNETSISSNLTKIGDNETNISSNLTKIGDNETNISSNLEKINSIEENNLKLSNIVFNDKYDIEKQLFSFNKNMHLFKLFEIDIENNFNLDGEFSINTIINYKYNNLKNDVNRLTHLYEFYNDQNILFYNITLDNHYFSKANFDENFLNINDNFCFSLVNTYNKIKIVLSLTRINEWGNGNIKLEMINDNYINITYKEKIVISKKFDENDKEIRY